MSNVIVYLEAMRNGSLNATSTLKLRNEAAQNKIKLIRWDRLRREVKKRSKLIAPLEIAIPFDPLVGEETELYNKDSKWRPLLSATTASLILKRLAAENEKVKETFMRRAGVDEWDLSNLEKLTEQDKHVFRLYRVPRILTIPVITINDERVTGYKNPVSYTISINRDPITGNVIGEWPIPLQINKLYRDMAYEEIRNIDDCIAKAKKGEPYELLTTISAFHHADLASMLDKDIKEAKKKVYEKIPVSEDRPANYMIMYEIPLENNLSIKDVDRLKTITKEELDKLGRIVSLTKELSEQALDNYRNGTWARHETHYDFWEFDMLCPTQVADEDDKMEIGRTTRYGSPEDKLREQSFYEDFHAKVCELIDDTKDLEERFMYSVRVNKYDTSLEAKLLDAIDSSNIQENPFLTKSVIKANANILSLALGEEGDTLIASTELGLNERAEGALDEAASAVSAKEMSVADIIGGSTENIVEASSEAAEAGASASIDAEEISLKD